MSLPTAPNIGTIFGELVTASGIVRNEIFEEAELVSQQSSLPVGRVLVMSGHLGEGDLTSALRAAQMVREGRLTRRQATLALREAYNQCMPFEQVVEDLLDYVPATRLGQLLSCANIVPITTLSKLEPRAEHLRPTLGQMLTTYGIISSNLLTNAIELLTLTRTSKISMTQAAEALRVCCVASLPAHTAIERVVGESVIDQRNGKIGHLLAVAGICSHADLLLAAEIGAEQNKPIGETLLELEKVDANVVKAALTLQSMMAAGTLSEGQAIEILHQAQSQHLPVEELIDELFALKKRVVELLKAAVLVSDNDIASAVEAYPNHAKDAARALIAAGIVDLKTVKNAVRCLSLMQSDGIKEDIAAAALRHSKRTGMSIEMAVRAASALDRPVTISVLGMKIVDAVHDHFEPPAQLMSLTA